MSDSDQLNYYLKNASTHATIVVAVVFGLFSILNLMRNIQDSNYMTSNIVLSVIYFGLVFFGCYIIDRWRFYKTNAKKIVGVKDHAWKNKRWIRAIDWFFEKAIFFFFTLCFFAWLAVASFLFGMTTMSLLGMFIFYIISGIIIWRFTKTSTKE